MAKVKSV